MDRKRGNDKGDCKIERENEIANSKDGEKRGREREREGVRRRGKVGGEDHQAERYFQGKFHKG